MSETPLVSIIVPTFNSEKYLGRCLTSIKNQTYKNLEVIIVDAGSRDNTHNIIEHYKTTLTIKAFTLSPSTQSEARNLALEHATGKYIAFCDSDDFYLPEKIITQVTILEHTNNEICYYDVLHFCSGNESGTFINNHPECEDIVLECIANQTINLNSVVIRKIFLDKHKLKFPDGEMGRYGEDGNFIFHLAINDGQFIKHSKPLSMVEVRNDSHTQWDAQWKMKLCAIKYREAARNIMKKKYHPAIDDAIADLKLKLFISLLIAKKREEALRLLTNIKRLSHPALATLIILTIRFIPINLISKILTILWKCIKIKNVRSHVNISDFS